AVNRAADSADAGIRAIVDAELGVQQERILDALAPPDDERELVAVAVQGWIALVRSVCVDWHDHPAVTGEQLRELCLNALRGMLGGRLG
ncbi:MAG: TetR/AcrR family transcriptional regulator, partial [Rhodococcus ruber]|nr:TetR/AcrR family transcriptional regulator [Rhodococcus ruber]